VKARSFEGIDHAVISVCLVADAESQLRVGLELVLAYNLDLILLVRPLSTQKLRIAEENHGRTAWNRAEIQDDGVTRRPRQEHLLLGQPCKVDLLGRLLDLQQRGALILIAFIGRLALILSPTLLLVRNKTLPTFALAP